jgi:hypothetical protein
MYILDDGSYDIRTQGALDQYSRVQTYGAKYDILMNMGFNFNDKFYLGFNIGMPVATYRYSEVFQERAIDPSQFEIEYQDGVVTNFTRANYSYNQTSDVSGIYTKVGFIWLPGASENIMRKSIPEITTEVRAGIYMMTFHTPLAFVRRLSRSTARTSGMGIIRTRVRAMYSTLFRTAVRKNLS